MNRIHPVVIEVMASPDRETLLAIVSVGHGDHLSFGIDSADRAGLTVAVAAFFVVAGAAQAIPDGNRDRFGLVDLFAEAHRIDLEVRAVHSL